MFEYRCLGVVCASGVWLLRPNQLLTHMYIVTFVPNTTYPAVTHVAVLNVIEEDIGNVDN